MEPPIRILTARLLLTGGAIALLSACGGDARPGPLVVVTRFTPPSGASNDVRPVDVRLLIQPGHRDQVSRYTAAVQMSLSVCTDWLGPFPRRSLTIADSRTGGAPLSERPDVTLDPAPWRDLPPAMLLELDVARGVARLYWHDAAEVSGLPAWFIDGLAEFTARRIAKPLFETRALPGGYAVYEQRSFGGLIPRLINIRLFPESDGEPLPAYRHRPRVDPAASALTEDDVRSLTGKTVLTLNMLERWMGRPTFDSAVAQFVRQYSGKPASIADFTRTVSAVSGQDLSWLLGQAFGSQTILDYGVERFQSEQEAGGFFQTQVVVRRFGDFVFTGTSAPPAGAFENGRGVILRVVFDDGMTRLDSWDGRDPSRTFVYRSSARAASAEVDPDHIVVLDVNQTNNSRAIASLTTVAATRWSARWLVWLQDFLLTYASLA